MLWTGITYSATKDGKRDRYVSMSKDLSSERSKLNFTLHLTAAAAVVSSKRNIIRFIQFKSSCFHPYILTIYFTKLQADFILTLWLPRRKLRLRLWFNVDPWLNGLNGLITVWSQTMDEDDENALYILFSYHKQYVAIHPSFAITSTVSLDSMN